MGNAYLCVGNVMLSRENPQAQRYTLILEAFERPRKWFHQLILRLCSGDTPLVPKERTVSLVILERTEDLGGGYYTDGPKHSSIPPPGLWSHICDSTGFSNISLQNRRPCLIELWGSLALPLR